MGSRTAVCAFSLCWERTLLCLESPDGLWLLHRLLVAAHLVFVQSDDCGIRSLCTFLKLIGLDEFIACSYGAQQAVARWTVELER